MTATVQHVNVATGKDCYFEQVALDAVRLFIPLASKSWKWKRRRLLLSKIDVDFEFMLMLTVVVLQGVIHTNALR